MSRDTIQEAQDYLTVRRDDKKRKILDIKILLKRHPEWRVVDFLDQMLREKEKALKDLVLMDKTNHKVDETIAGMFRLNMAIKTIEREREVKAA